MAPITATSVAENSRRLAGRSDGRQIHAIIMARKGAQLLDIATVVRGKFFTFIMFTQTVMQNYIDLIARVGMISLFTFLQTTSLIL